MKPKPKQWGAAYASIFRDSSVVAAYQYRPPYPAQTFEILAGLIPPNTRPRTVLDAGCGTGSVARPLARHVDRVDAVDISEAMIASGRTLPGGNDTRLRWICGAIESVDSDPPYALIVAAASLHWMEWEIVLPRFAAWLNPNNYLALVEDIILANPWDAEVRPVLGQYSMNRDFQPYTMRTIAQELEQRGLFREAGALNTTPVLFRQPLAEWVESFHARNGLSRDRMDPRAANECDQRLMDIIARYCPSRIVEQQVAGQVIWGTPGSGS